MAPVACTLELPGSVTVVYPEHDWTLIVRQYAVCDPGCSCGHQQTWVIDTLLCANCQQQGTRRFPAFVTAREILCGPPLTEWSLP